jgi:hypothetical protein
MTVFEPTPITDTPPPAGASAEVAIPNFREDERLFARYEAMLQRRIKTFGMEHESSIRRNASAKRDELREELAKAEGEHARVSALAATAREAYRKAFPRHVKRTRLVEPTMVENLRSLGKAKKLYLAAHEAWLAAEHAMSAIRRIEHNEPQLEIELQRALERAPDVIKDVTESEEWLAEIHAEDDLAEIKAKVDAIVAERDGYTARLAAGAVGDAERRLRAWAQQGVKPLAVPAAGLLFVRVDRYGEAAYFIARDVRKQLYALPYDRRLEPLLDGVYDLEKNGTAFAARVSRRANSPLQLTVREHFQMCFDDEAAAQLAYQAHREFIKQPRSFAATPCDQREAAAIAALVALVPA